MKQKFKICYKILYFYLIDEKFISDIRSHNFRVLKTLKKISVFCMEDEQINSIEIDKGFDYGKHGQKAIERLFERVGIKSCAYKKFTLLNPLL